MKWLFIAYSFTFWTQMDLLTTLGDLCYKYFIFVKYTINQRIVYQNKSHLLLKGFGNTLKIITRQQQWILKRFFY
jgi:hypothetical protein